MKYLVIIFSALTIFGFSCSKEETVFLPYEEQLEIDVKIIDEYLAQNGLTADTTLEGLRYDITSTGSGQFPKTGNVVVVNYTGKSLNGDVFDSNTSGGFSFPLGEGRVIQGWDIGIALLSEGGKATLYIPSGLAYGTRGAGSSIAPNEVLIFDVELVEIR